MTEAPNENEIEYDESTKKEEESEEKESQPAGDDFEPPDNTEKEETR